MRNNLFKKFFVCLAFFLGCFFAFNITLNASVISSDYKSLITNISDVKEIYFTSNTVVPDGAIVIDVSANNDDSVFAYTTQDLVDNKYILYICSSNPIELPADSYGFFSELSSLELIDFDNFSASSAQNVSYMFYGNPNLYELDLTNWDISQIDFDEAFAFFNTNIEVVTLPAGSNIKLPDGVWTNDSTQVKYKSENIVPTATTTYVKSVYTMGVKNNTLYISNYPIPDVPEEDNLVYPEGTPIISTFYEHYGYSASDDIISSITKIVVGGVGSNDTVDLISMNMMFYYFTYVEEIDFADISTSNLVDLYGAFAYTPKLTSLDLSDINTSHIENYTDYLTRCGVTTITVGANWYIPFGSGSWRNTNGDVYDYDEIPSNVADTYTKVLNYWGLNTTTHTFYISGIERNDDLHGVFDLYEDTVNDVLTQYDDPDNGYPTVTKVVVGTSSTDIIAPVTMRGWFQNLDELTTVDFTYLNTSGVLYMNNLFSGCSSLESLVLSNFDTSNVLSMYGMFSGCSSLTSLNINNFNTENVRDMGRMFAGCSSLTTINVGSFNTHFVEDMSGMFNGCESLTSLNLNNFDTTNVFDMDYMFAYCSSLTTLNLNSFITSQVEDMSNMFEGCESLTALNLSSFTTPEVTDMNSMFDGCLSLTTLDLSGFNTEKVTNMSYMFNGCSKLSVLNLNGWNTSSVTSMRYMFNGCVKLTSIDLSGFFTEEVYDFSRMFYNSGFVNLDISTFNSETAHYYEDFIPDTLKTIKIGTNWNVGLCSGSWKNTAGEVFTYNNLPLNTADTYTRASLFWGINYDNRTLYISNDVVDVGDNSIHGIMNLDGSLGPNGTDDYTPWLDVEFYGGDTYIYNNGQVENVVVGTSSSDIVRPTYMSYWFAHLPFATNYDFTYLDTSNVLSMDYLFDGNVDIQTLDLSSFNTSKVTKMNHMFSGCQNLRNLNLSSFDTSKVRTIEYMFENTYLLETLDISNFNLGSVVLKDGIFDNSGIKQIKVSNTFNGINLPVGDYEDLATGILYAYDEIPSNHAATYKMKVLYYAVSDGVLRINDYEMTGDLVGTASARGTNNPWVVASDFITSVVVGSEGHVIKPESTASWFEGLYKATSFDLRYLDTSNVTDMTGMFAVCGFQTIDLSNLNTSKVISMGAMFEGCDELVSIDLSSFDFSKVENMELMFHDCVKLKNINFGTPNTSSLTDMYALFAGCSSLEKIDLSKFNTSNVISMYSTFSGATSLKEIDLRNLDLSKLEDSGGIFHRCDNLEVVRVNDLDVFKLADNDYDDPLEIFGNSPKATILISKAKNKDISYSKSDLPLFNEQEQAKTGIIKTGDKVKIIVGDGESTGYINIVVVGDANKDGKIDISDVMKVATHTIKKNVLKTNIEKIAADVVRSSNSSVTNVQDKDINISDIMKIATYSIKGGEL